jgi:Ca-activated chloride channel family protein
MEADYMLDYDVLAAACEHHLYLLACIKAKSQHTAASRSPINLSVVLDRSGSMEGDKLKYVKEATQVLVQRLGANDRFSLVTYNHRVQVNISPGPVIHKDEINRAIRAIQAVGRTNLSGGWLRGCQSVAEGSEGEGIGVERTKEGSIDRVLRRVGILRRPRRDAPVRGQINRVLLLTDGLANEGVTDPRRLAEMARQKRRKGITTTTMGVGMDFNEDLLAHMGSEGGGAFYFIDYPDQASQIFDQELGDMLSVVGQNLEITLTLSPDVQMVRQLNTYPADATDRGTTFRLGDLYAEEAKSLLLELRIPALEELGEVELARLRFDYDELGEEGVAHQTLVLPIAAKIVPEADYDKDQVPNPEVVRMALLLRAARAREEAIGHADRGDFRQAMETLEEVADAIHGAGLDDDELQAEHDMLRERAVDMEMGEWRYSAHVRKTDTATASLADRPIRRGYTNELHRRLKLSRRAIERNGPTPTAVMWKRERLDLTVDLLRIGRAEDNDIVIPEEGVSKYHCQIVRDGDNLFLVDLNSTNGTFANAGLVEGRFRLSVHDVATVGSWLFMFQ